MFDVERVLVMTWECVPYGTTLSEGFCWWNESELEEALNFFEQEKHGWLSTPVILRLLEINLAPWTKAGEVFTMDDQEIINEVIEGALADLEDNPDILERGALNLRWESHPST